MVMPLRRSEAVLGQAGCSGVIPHDRRRPRGAAPGELGTQVDAVDAMEVWAKLGDSLSVDHPRAADAEGWGWAGPLSGRTRLSTERTASTGVGTV